MKPITLLEWCRDPTKHPADEMLWKGACWDQIIFARDTLRYIMGENRDQETEVVGYHTSKSIKLPVYHFKNSHFEIWFRCNFYDWSITVKSQHPVDYEFCGVLMKEDPGGGCCFEGMDKFREKWYRPRQQMLDFSTVVFNEYDMYLFAKTLCHAFGVRYEEKK